MKIKRLIPSLREARRYLAFEVIGNSVRYEDFNMGFNDSLRGFMGDLESAKARVKLLRETYADNKGIVAVGPKYVNHVKSVMLFVGCVKSLNVPCSILDRNRC